MSTNNFEEYRAAALEKLGVDYTVEDLRNFERWRLKVLEGLAGIVKGDDIVEAVNDWLDDHPEASTTVQDGAISTAKVADGAITDAKLASSGVKSELADVRVGADGYTYPTAGDAVRNQVDDLKSASKRGNSGIDTLLLYGRFQRASLNSGGLNPNFKYRVATNDILTFDRDIELTVASGFRFAVHTFVNGVFSQDSNWQTNNYSINAGTSFKIVIARTTEDTSETADILTFVEAVTFNTRVEDNLTTLNKIITDSKYNLFPADSSAWEYGRIDPSTGEDVSTTSYLRTKNYIEITEGECVAVNVGSVSFALYILCYSNSEYISRVGNTMTVNGVRYFTLPVGTTKVRLQIDLAAEKENVCFAKGSFAEYVSHEVINKYKIEPKSIGIAKLEESAQKNLCGIGEQSYTGERIVLADDTRTNKCDIRLWADFLPSVYANLASYRFYLHQSMAMFNGYVFLLQETGSITVLDYNTKEIVGTFAIEPEFNQHANSAQFSNVFYDNSDDFPLLLVSRCGNASEGVTGKDECQIYRITLSDSTFSATLINTISCDVITKGNSWAIDNNSNLIYMIGSAKGWWETNIDAPIEIYAWKMPTKTQLISGNNIEFEKNTAIAQMESPYRIVQGCCVNGGIMYVGIQISGEYQRYVYAIDVFKNRITSIIPLIDTLECEGVSVYDGKIYVSHKNGGDGDAVNPLKIYEVDFNN